MTQFAHEGCLQTKFFSGFQTQKNQLATCGRNLFVRAESLARSIGVARISGEIDLKGGNLMKFYDNLCTWHPHYSFNGNGGSGIMYQSKTRNSVMFSPWVTCLSHPPEKKKPHGLS